MPPKVESHTNGEDDYEIFYKAYCEKGNIGLYINLVVMMIGIIMTYTADGIVQDIGVFVLSFGLFGFAGGITNWLAIHMLFEKVPFLYGSGVIPTRYKEIRVTVKDVIMGTFFDETFLENYISQKLKSVGDTIDTDAKVKEMIESEKFDAVLDDQLANLGDRPEFAPLAGFGGAKALKPMIKPFVSGLGLELAPLMKEKLTDTKFSVNIPFVRKEIEHYLSVRIETLTEQKVTRLLENVIRGHLGWLIVWGNVFGSIIGVLSQAVGLTPDYLGPDPVGNSTNASFF
eukprot:m.41903 g.41903  ORF g.41903 m.41903 type:complete len:286 (+) comp9822_c0_seq1:206-1063(+)